MRVTKTDLVDEISKSTNVTKKDVSAVITALGKTVVEHLEIGDDVILLNIGRFSRKVSKSRKVYSVRERSVVTSNANYRVRFYPSVRLMQVIKSHKVVEEDDG